MATAYLESSAFVALLLGESSAAAVTRALDQASTVVTSVLTDLEVSRALNRVEREGVITEGDAQRIRGLCKRTSDSWIRMEITDDVLERAARPFPVEPVRTLDALHLASALAFTRAFADLQVVSCDGRVRDNAVALGIA